MSAELLVRLHDHEDNFTERKPANLKGEDLRRTIVAFANSVPEGRSAVLFIGVRDDGTIQGVSDTDSVQQSVGKVCREICYPAIKFHSEVLKVDDANIVAVVVPPSTDRPHFAGPAFVREGSRSVRASEAAFEELVTGRFDKPREILKWRGNIVTVTTRGKELGSTKRSGSLSDRGSTECRVLGCSPHIVRLEIVSAGKTVAEPLKNVTISHDEVRDRLLIIVEEPWNPR